MSDWPNSDEYAHIKSLAKQGLWEEVLVDIKCHETSTFNSNWGNRLLSDIAMFSGSHNCLKYLLNLGANANFNDPYYGSPICNAINGGNRYGSDTLKELEVLLSVKPDLNIACEAGYPPLHWSIVQNKLGHTDILLKHGADPYALTSDQYPETAFDIANRINNNEAIEILRPYRNH